MEDWKTIAEITNKVGQIVIALIGGGWAFWKFEIQREARAKIEFGLGLNFIEFRSNAIIVEVVATVSNRGKVRHWLKNFYFNLHYLNENAPIVMGDKRINFQLLYKKTINRRYWHPEDWMGTFIDSGVTQIYTYVASVPRTATSILVFGHFKYPNTKDEFHTAQKVFTVPKIPDAQPIGHDYSKC